MSSSGKRGDNTSYIRMDGGVARLVECMLESGELRGGGQRVIQKEVEKFEIRGVSSERGDRVTAMTEDACFALDLSYRGFAGEGVGESGVVAGVTGRGEGFG